MKSKTGTILGAAVCAVVCAANAADVSVPDSGDLADPALWGGTLPAATDRPLFEGSQGRKFNMTASEDVSFAGIMFGLIYEWTTVTFDLRDSVSGGDTPNGAPRTVTLTDSITATTQANRYYTYFKGGKWNVTGNLEFYGNERKFVQDGAEMTLTGNVQPAHGAANNSQITFTGAGTSVTAARALTHITGGYYGGNVISIRDGASLTLTGGDASTPAIKTGDQGGDKNGLTVSGSASSLVIQNSDTAAWFGSGLGASHFLHVENGGAFATGGELRIGSTSGRNINGVPTLTCVSNEVVATGTGSTISAGKVNIGYCNLGWDWSRVPRGDRFVVADGAVADISGLVTIGYADSKSCFSLGNEMIVSNATFRSPTFPTIGATEGCSNNVLRVIGQNARFEANVNETLWSKPHCTFFQLATDCLFEIDGASVTNNTALYTRLVARQFASGHNAFRLQNGAEFFTTNTFSITGYEYAAPSNTVEILSGSRLYAGAAVMTYSEGNRYVIDDGILESGGNISVTQTASSSTPLGQQSPNCRNELCVGGANGRVLAENGTLSIARESSLRFAVPLDGYATGVVPVKARTITVSNDSAIAVDGAELRAANKALRKSETVTLATATSALSIPQTVIDAANAKIAGFAKLKVDGNSLLLRIMSLNNPTLLVIH